MITYHNICGSGFQRMIQNPNYKCSCCTKSLEIKYNSLSSYETNSKFSPKSLLFWPKSTFSSPDPCDPSKLQAMLGLSLSIRPFPSLSLASFLRKWKWEAKQREGFGGWRRWRRRREENPRNFVVRSNPSLSLVSLSKKKKNFLPPFCSSLSPSRKRGDT